MLAHLCYMLVSEDVAAYFSALYLKLASVFNKYTSSVVELYIYCLMLFSAEEQHQCEIYACILYSMACLDRL